MPEFDRRPAQKRRSVNQGGSRVSAGVRRRKENIFISIFRGLLPWKGDAPGDVVRKIIFMGSLVLLIWATFSVLDSYVFNDIKLKNERRELIEIQGSYEGPDRKSIGMGNDGEQVEVIGKYAEYYELNDDFVGFVEIFPIVQHPVYQAEDNDYYLKHNHNKLPTANGTIFADYEGAFTASERPHNTIIYGHNLVIKELFQPLVNYRPVQNSKVDSFDFLKENPIIKFDTLYEEGYYKI
ncbi:MAG: class B sortase, partial [Oscillospiraceae bacterium]|nr:class B sortase [Oscillospiraceae bacterium]